MVVEFKAKNAKNHGCRILKLLIHKISWYVLSKTFHMPYIANMKNAL